MSEIDRRSFLKLAGAAAPALLLPGAASWMRQNVKQTSKPNIIIIVFDAMSAANLSVYGYPRRTTPNFERFAEHANVYHSHRSGGNFTIPGTASLLTGTYSWTHRAINHSGEIKHDLVDNNIFHVLGSEYHRVAFPQTVWSGFIVSQFEKDIKELLPSSAFGEVDFLLSRHFLGDRNMATRALDDFIFRREQVPVPLILGTLQNIMYARKTSLLNWDGYPRGPIGLPHNANYPVYFRLEKLIDGLASYLLEQPMPFMGYFHLFPPHAPYRPNIKFNQAFVDDGYRPVSKPAHRFSEGLSDIQLNTSRRQYDQYIASMDDEFGRLLDAMEEAGVFENSYVAITSDHGEMFERGEKAHSTSLLYEPVMHIPLLVSAPGQKVRRDIYAPTNAVDLLPTFANAAGQPIPTWCEGKLLPGLGGEEDMNRSTFTIEAKLSFAFQPFDKVTVAMQAGEHKLIYYRGYESDDSFELYDLKEDPEELKDLYPDGPAFVKQMKEELLETLFAANKAYEK